MHFDNKKQMDRLGTGHHSLAKRYPGQVWIRLSRSLGLYLFLLPAVTYFFIHSYLPLYGIQLAFKAFSPQLGITGSPWIGFTYFKQFFESYYFWRFINNTVGLNLYILIAAFPFPIILALLFNEITHKRFKESVQTIAYAPHFISSVVLVSLLMLFFSRTGFINIVRQNMGFETIPFLTSPSLFPHMYVWSGIWQNAGWSSIIYIAALSGIDPQLHEAAQIDGASRLKRIWHINLPGIKSTAVILFILETGRIMNVGFEKIFLMQNNQNIAASDVISTYVYKMGLINMEYGFSTAIGFFNNIINLTLLLLVNRISRKITDKSLF
jgi:putative aldouronate transport system permease protein